MFRCEHMEKMVSLCQKNKIFNISFLIYFFQGLFVGACRNSRQHKCHYNVLFRFVGNVDTTEERAKLHNWRIEKNNEVSAHTLMPSSTDQLPKDFSKNKTRFCIYSIDYFYHSVMRSDVVLNSFQTGENETTSRATKFQNKYDPSCTSSTFGGYGHES